MGFPQSPVKTSNDWLTGASLSALVAWIVLSVPVLLLLTALLLALFAVLAAFVEFVVFVWLLATLLRLRFIC